jgi:hypothetical protein
MGYCCGYRYILGVCTPKDPSVTYMKGILLYAQYDLVCTAIAKEVFGQLETILTCARPYSTVISSDAGWHSALGKVSVVIATGMRTPSPLVAYLNLC